MQKQKLLFYFSALMFGGAGAWIISKYGFKFGVMDQPSERSSHNTAVPKGGGIGIVAALVFASVNLNMPKIFWISATFIALLSLYGDRNELSTTFRLSIQFVAALAFLAPMLFFNSHPHFSLQYVHSADAFIPAAIPLVVLLLWSVFIVGTANFFNFMDGINGIAGITGAVGFGFLAFYWSGLESFSTYATFSGCVSLACIGFLPFNIPCARVFMGDVGSILLGFTFAGMIVWLSTSLLDFICLAAFIFPFYADELTTMMVRIKDGENLSRPHRRHTYQLLANEYGISHWKISVGYGVGQLFVGMSTLMIKKNGGFAVLLMLTIYFFCFMGLSLSLRRRLTAIN